MKSSLPSTAVNSLPSQRAQCATFSPILKVTGSPWTAGSAAALLPLRSLSLRTSISLRNACSGICARPDIQRKSVFSGTRRKPASACVLPWISAALASVRV